jgi:MFS family permease
MTTRRVFPRVSYGWYVLAASFAILFLNTGGRYVVGVLVKPVAAEFGWSRGAISLAILVNMVVDAAAILVTGRLYDRYGAKWVVAVSTVLFSAGYALMATMHSQWEFLLYYGVLNAAGLGGTAVPMFGSIIGHWFKRRRGLAVSLAFAGSCLGQFFLLPVFSNMINDSGWRSTLLWIAGLAFVLNLGLTFGVLRRDPDPLEKQDPGHVGVREALAPNAGRSLPPAETPDRDLTLLEAMRSRSLWMFTIAMFVCGSADMLVTTHLVPMVTDYGLSDGTAASMLAWLGLLSLAGILLAGPAADAIGNKLPIIITFGLRVVLCVMLIAFKGVVPFWIFSLGFGLTLLVTAPLVPTLVSSLYGVTHIGFISAFISTVHMLGGGVWVYLGGVIFDRTGSYDFALLLSAVTAGVALVFTLLIREVRHKAPVADLDASLGV